VIQPHLDTILDKFYQALFAYPQASRVLDHGFSLVVMKHAQHDYLLSLGIDFQTEEYFEKRLQIGLAHLNAGVGVSLYQCAYLILQQLLLDYVAPHHEQREQLTRFILKIAALDMSLAIESYHDQETESLERTIASLRDEATMLNKKVAIDSLTGVASRERILDALADALQRSTRANSVSVLMVDLDHFKQVNDELGHLTGDRVLRGVAGRIKSAIRRVNYIGRYGGEEFLVIVMDAQGESACLIAERIRSQVADNPVKVRNSTIPITVSVGVASAHPDDTVESLIDRADKALYMAKRGGRNRVEVLHRSESPAQ
jgi:diguanylate cyclase (GGDEF)-like protein